MCEAVSFCVLCWSVRSICPSTCLIFVFLLCIVVLLIITHLLNRSSRLTQQQPFFKPSTPRYPPRKCLISTPLTLLKMLQSSRTVQIHLVNWLLILQEENNNKGCSTLRPMLMARLFQPSRRRRRDIALVG